MNKRYEKALVTVGCFMAGAPMPPKSLRHFLAVITLTNYPRLSGKKVMTNE